MNFYMNLHALYSPLAKQLNIIQAIQAQLVVSVWYKKTHHSSANVQQVQKTNNNKRAVF